MLVISLVQKYLRYHDGAVSISLPLLLRFYVSVLAVIADQPLKLPK